MNFKRLGFLLSSFLALSALATTNTYKQPAPSIFYNTVTLPQLGTSGFVTNTSGGLLGTSNKLSVLFGGTNSSTALSNNRVIVSSGGTIGESSTTLSQLGFLDATSSIQTQLNGKQSTISILPIANGGTNYGTALVNNRLIVSSGGTIGEFTQGLSGQVLQSNGAGVIPSWVVDTPSASNITGTLAINHGGTNSATALVNNRFVVSSGGTIGEYGLVTPNSLVGSDSNGLPQTVSIPLSVANGGRNSSTALVNNRVIVSSGGTIGESATTTTSLGFLDATSSIQTQLNGKQATLTLPLTVANGGTNSPTALVNNRLVVTSGGTIGEFTQGTSGQILQTNGAGVIPSWVTNAPAAANVTGVLAIANGGRNSGTALVNNRLIVSTGGTIGEFAQGNANQILQSNGAGVAPSWVANVPSGVAPVANGGTNSGTALQNNRIIVSSGGTIGEGTPGLSGQVLTSNGAGSIPTWATTASAPTAPSDMQNIGFSTSVSANAMTINIKQSDGATDPTSGSPAKIAFRDVTAVTGDYIVRSVTAALSITISSGATLGHTSAVNQYIYLWAIDNAGTVELAVSGSRYFDAGSVQSTTIMNSSSTDWQTLYSTVARTSKPIRLLARIKSNQTTAGTYAANATEISPYQGYDWPRTTQGATWSPTFSAGFGTVTNSRLFYKRTDNFIDVWGDVTAGVVAASLAQIILPSGNSIDSSLMSSSSTIGFVGTSIGTETSAVFAAPNGRIIFYDGSDTANLYFANNAAANVYTKLNGSGVFNNSEVIPINIKGLPIKEYRSY